MLRPLPGETAVLALRLKTQVLRAVVQRIVVAMRNILPITLLRTTRLHHSSTGRVPRSSVLLLLRTRVVIVILRSVVSGHGSRTSAPVVAVISHNRHAVRQLKRPNRKLKRRPTALLAKIRGSTRNRTVSAVDVAYQKQRGPHGAKYGTDVASNRQENLEGLGLRTAPGLLRPAPWRPLPDP